MQQHGFAYLSSPGRSCQTIVTLCTTCTTASQHHPQALNQTAHCSLPSGRAAVLRVDRCDTPYTPASLPTASSAWSPCVCSSQSWLMVALRNRLETATSHIRLTLLLVPCMGVSTPPITLNGGPLLPVQSPKEASTGGNRRSRQTPCPLCGSRRLPPQKAASNGAI